VATVAASVLGLNNFCSFVIGVLSVLGPLGSARLFEKRNRSARTAHLTSQIY
jgi:hypothetical protein